MKRKRTFTYVTGKKYDGMMGRCYRPSDISYESYGGRGIRVCSAWIKDINSFRTWVLLELEKANIDLNEFIEASSKYSLDRIDVNGHYSPDNCRFADAQTQGRNRRRSKLSITSAEGEELCV